MPFVAKVQKERRRKNQKSSVKSQKKNTVAVPTKPTKKQVYSKVTARNMLLQLEVSVKGAVPTVMANMLGIGVKTVVAIREDNFTDEQCEIFINAANKYLKKRDARKERQKNKQSNKNDKPPRSTDEHILEKEARRLLHQMGGELNNHDAVFLADKLKVSTSLIYAVRNTRSTVKQDKELVTALRSYINGRFTKVTKERPKPKPSHKLRPIDFASVIAGLMSGIILSAVDVEGVTKVKLDTARNGERSLTFFSNIDDEVESDQRMTDGDYNIKWIPTYNLELLQAYQC